MEKELKENSEEKGKFKELINYTFTRYIFVIIEGLAIKYGVLIGFKGAT